MTIYYDKLIRDNIVSIIEAKGEQCFYRQALPEQLPKYIGKKITEELLELLDASDPNDILEEQADLWELLQHIQNTYLKDVDVKLLKAKAEEKRKERGAFNLNTILLFTTT